MLVSTRMNFAFEIHGLLIPEDKWCFLSFGQGSMD